MFYHLVDITINNCYHCFKELTGEDITGVDFRLDLIEEIINVYSSSKHCEVKKRGSYDNSKNSPFLKKYVHNWSVRIPKPHPDSKQPSIRCVYCESQGKGVIVSGSVKFVMFPCVLIA